MANANAEALEAAIGSIPEWDELTAAALARRLAERGVLAISALTVEQLGDLNCLEERTQQSPVDYLRRIARGEPNA